jgi:hypothetical protein
MAYFEDFSPYTYLVSKSERNLVNVGWLDNKHAFARGKLPDQAIEALLDLCASPVNRTRGFHTCPFCDNLGFGIVVQKCGREFRLGSAEIRVRTATFTYVAPDMIYHYVVAHGYLPPQDFVSALMSPTLGAPDRS